jgi:hypothetical protein
LIVGTIIAIVVGSLIYLGVLVSIIVLPIILSKRKRSRVWIAQAQQQQISQLNFINEPGKQWSYGLYQPPPAGTMNIVNPQYPPPYYSDQPFNVQAGLLPFLLSNDYFLFAFDNTL